MVFPIIGIVVSLLVSIGLSAILRAITRPPQAEAGDVEVPRVEEGEPIAAVFGTVKLAPDIVWWGDVTIEPIKGPRRVFGLVGPRDTIGHRYHVGMQGALCWGPVDALVEIVVADKYKLSTFGATTTRELAEDGTYTEFTSQVVAPFLPIARIDAGVVVNVEAANLFGGKELEGGVFGPLRFYFGTATQDANAYLEGVVASPFPGYRGLCHVVWEHVYVGTTPYLKHWHFVVRRCPTTLGALAGDVTLSRIGDDANPAEVLYELWTDTRWGLGKPASDLDLDSFLAALATLAEEGMGISGPHGGTGEADAKVKEILRHIDAAFGPDPLTGKMRLALIREDYDVATLPVFDASNSSNLSVSRPVWGERTTQVKVTYTDAAKDFTTRTRQAHNPAVERAQGYAIPAVVSYPLFTTPANAERAAARDCRALSANLAVGSIVCDRSASRLGPGDPFVLNFPDDGLTNVVVRAARCNYGTIHGEEPVEIQLAEDVFGAAGGVLVTTPPDEWTPPPATDAGRRFDVETELTISDEQGCLTLRITGDVSSITLVETRTQEGGQAAGDWTEQDNAAPITVCVARDDREVGRIAYRITYTDGDGEPQTLEDEFPIPPLGADDGNAQGTPGNWPLTMRTTPPLVLVGAEVGTDALVEPPEAKADRVYVNLTKVRRMRMQLGSGRAAGEGVVAGLLYSLTGGPPFAALGPEVSVAAVRYPSAGDFAAIAEAAAGQTNVLMTWGTKGGNGSTTVAELGNIYVEAVSSTAPPPSPDPPTTDVPTGGPLGNVILDLDATHPEVLDYTYDVEPDGLYFDQPGMKGLFRLPDQSPSENDAEPGQDSPVSAQQDPTYIPDAFGPGIPGVRMIGVGPTPQGLIYDQPTKFSHTWYIVLTDALMDLPPVGVPYLYGPIVLGLNTPPFGNMGLLLRSDYPDGPVRIYAFVFASAWENPFVLSGVIPYRDDPPGIPPVSGKLLIRWVIDTTTGLFWLYINGELVDGCPINFLVRTLGDDYRLFAGTQFFYEPAGGTSTVTMGRYLVYDRPHVGSVGDEVEARLRTQFGLD